MGKQFFKQIPDPLRWLINPALLAALGLHAIALLLPLPAWKSPESAQQPAPAEVDLEVALSPMPVPRQPVPSPPPSPAPARPAPSVALRPPTQSVQPVRPILPQPRPVQPPVAAPAAPPAPSPTPTPLPSPEPVPAPAIPFADLPQLAGTEVGCFGLSTCHQLSNGTSFRAAGQTLEAELVAQGYQVRLRDDLEETGRKVYEISKDDKTRFLNVLSTDVGTTVYLVTPQPIHLAELQNSETLKAELSAILDGLSTTSAHPTQFSQPSAFYLNTTPHPGTDGRLRSVAGSTPDALLASLTQTLQSQNFRLQDAGGYGGGRLYEVTKGAYTGYLNLVPSLDQHSTIVVLWQALPK